jgi:hypothetical protein
MQTARKQKVDSALSYMKEKNRFPQLNDDQKKDLITKRAAEGKIVSRATGLFRKSRTKVAPPSS